MTGHVIVPQAFVEWWNIMIEYTQNEERYLRELAQRLLRDFLNSVNFDDGKDLARWFECVAQIKAIQGNSNND
jgi:hypothetical protein